jgi:hypothetical protein
MKRTIISAAVLALGLAGAGVSLADPGPGNGHNGWGLCNAYAHNGGNNHGQAFQALEEAAGVEDGDSDADVAKKVSEFCAQTENQKPGGGKG